MSLQSASTTLDSLHNTELQYILSFLGPNNGFARTCRRFRQIHREVMGELGIALVRGVDGELWDPKLFPTRADSRADSCMVTTLTKAQGFCKMVGTTCSSRGDMVVEPLSLSIDEGYDMLKAAFEKVRTIWKKWNLRGDDQFRNHPPESVIVDPHMVSYLFDMDKLARMIQQDSPVVSFSELKRILQSTTSLNLFRNNLSHIPHSVGTLTALTSLYLSDNQLTSLPREIGNLKALRVLDLGCNQLTSLPLEIGNFTALTILNLCNNQLTFLPREVGRLRSLTVLGLGNNLLTSLPCEIGNLTTIAFLDLSKNKIRALPREIGSLRSLTFFNLKCNPLDTGSPNTEILSTLRETCRYSQDVEEAIQQHDEGLLGEPPTRRQKHEK